jgi:hypothetical protein
MSKPVRHYGSWRIRWIDERGRRHSAVVNDHKAALLLLRQKELEADERKRGLREPVVAKNSFHMDSQGDRRGERSGSGAPIRA